MDDTRVVEAFFPANPHLDLFYNTKRDTHRQNVHILLQDSWQCNPSQTLKIIFYLRDCRGGPGHKALFYIALKWLITNHAQEFRTNISHIPHYGSFKDLLQFLDTNEAKNVLTYLADQLKHDKALLGTDEAQNISRAGKWAPSQNGYHDRQYQTVAKLCGLLGVNKAVYRKEYLVPLRRHIGIVEREMSDNRWQDIDFRQLTMINRKFYEKAWERHREADYKKFVSQPYKFQVRTDYLYQMLIPHLVKGTEINAEVEQKWADQVEKVGAQWVMGNILTMVDTSNKMSVSCKAPAIYMSLLITNFNIKNFNSKCISFSTNPQFIYVKGKTLQKQLRTIVDAPAQATVNLEYAFNMILRSAARLKVSAKNMPKMLIIFANRPFKEVCVLDNKNMNKDKDKNMNKNKDKDNKDKSAEKAKGINTKKVNNRKNDKSVKGTNNKNGKTDFALIERKYNAAGYKRPILIYWNLKGSTINFSWNQTVPDTLLINGFNHQILELFEEGQVPTPLSYMTKVIHSERYNIIQITPKKLKPNSGRKK